ncbi:myc-type, basic helix-loop-helix (bHLH) domain-containing protein [Artemisia annua]|uniref:Myc-type, basic helix-loop-helix (BHLH) domain-containing protein n=1 Tax=Artemisia annua TaxID=35608 RepID=A0A2U1N136_ARTAN|nr:myc-type, basic helix-loop-helix (bHLH) domain-containing protein [Artemisia annua]
MALETLSSNELLNFIIYDTISASPFTFNDSSSQNTNNSNTFFYNLHNQNPNPNPNPLSQELEGADMEIMSSNSSLATTTEKMSLAVQAYCGGKNPEKNYCDNNNNNKSIHNNLGVQKKKRRRRPRVCKNKEEAESQRMTHIAVERNRRKQMNEHLAVLRSLMPESYVQRGDQASIVGGAIEFVKELEHLLQSLEAKKFVMTQQPQEDDDNGGHDSNFTKLSSAAPPFSQFFSYPQYTCSQIPNKYTSKSKAAIADIEVTLIETHANLRILSQKRLAQLSKMVACFQTLYLSVLHLNVTTMEPLVLYSISVKVEEGCRLNSADEIAGAVHQMLRIIEEEATLCVVDSR